MRSAQILQLSRCVTPAGVIKRGNIIEVPDMAKAVRRPPAGVAGFAGGLKPGMRGGNFYGTTGQRQFSGVNEPTLLGSLGGTLRGAGQAALSPILGAVHAGGEGPGRQSLLGGIATHGSDALGHLFQGNMAGAGRALKQVGRDVNPFNSKGSWAQSIQRHVGKGTEDVTKQIPHWWNYPGGFWEQWGGQATNSAKNYENTAL